MVPSYVLALEALLVYCGLVNAVSVTQDRSGIKQLVRREVAAPDSSEGALIEKSASLSESAGEAVETPSYAAVGSIPHDAADPVNDEGGEDSVLVDEADANSADADSVAVEADSAMDDEPFAGDEAAIGDASEQGAASLLSTRQSDTSDEKHGVKAEDASAYGRRRRPRWFRPIRRALNKVKRWHRKQAAKRRKRWKSIGRGFRRFGRRIKRGFRKFKRRMKKFGRRIKRFVKKVIVAPFVRMGRKILRLPAPSPGPPGPIGLTGPPGWKGMEGLEGPQGPRGEPGKQGKTGIRGVQGIKGDTGSQGPVGAKGEKGEPGDMGRQGAEGPMGAFGEQGPQGLPGPPGQPGKIGHKGNRGAPGVDGAPGETGLPGPRGPRGARGLKGDPGPKGSPGEHGKNAPPYPIIDCQWAIWEDWEDCFVTCGHGFQRRERAIDTYPQDGGLNCEGPHFEMRDCEYHKCPDPTHMELYGFEEPIEFEGGTQAKHNETHVAAATPREEENIGKSDLPPLPDEHKSAAEQMRILGLVSFVTVFLSLC